MDNKSIKSKILSHLIHDEDLTLELIQYATDRSGGLDENIIKLTNSIIEAINNSGCDDPIVIYLSLKLAEARLLDDFIKNIMGVDL